ncbi:Ubiquitin carboxyl-terminal hydrolase domain-containing protein [Phytophthora infestans]|uniref:Ubiquitin carboxyl-terminal hydrolase n=1 Tax=Phytophthora infestans TaxID=4787 RepID=A0A833W597_PHYIN|nr:Ubiquitin carboxyl-terminal hydrolase domain-containing protein [Phytophthora infestans]KAF4127948.1 Ubiquitin carboxyl-terminal hydrolase domain-containing protein [Phytophthora infestans]
MADWASSLGVRFKSSRFPWLLLLWWTQTILWLRRWLKIWVHRPLMRLGIGSEDDEEVEHEANLTQSDDQQQSDAALPCGLVNSGNLCFVSAILQCLAAVPGFLDGVDRALRMRTQLHMVQQADDVQTQKLLVAETLVSLLRGISPIREALESEVEAEARQERHRHNRDDNLQKMRSFRSAASRCTFLLSSAASRQEQQDAEEFLTFLLELLHGLLRAPAQPVRSNEEERQHFLRIEKLLLKKLRSYNPNDPRSYMQAVANLGEVRWNYSLRKNSSVITDLFSGQTVRGSQCCSCATLSCLHEEQRVISLPIAAGKGDQTLAECLEHFRHPEQLTGENRVFCDGFCKTKTTRLTQILLQRVSPVLVLRLQRLKHTSVRGHAEKVDTPVSFPCGRDELLDITMNAFFRDDERGDKFELVAVCAHLGGSHDSGHYVAYVRHRDSRRDGDSWLRIDDEVVSVIEESKLRSETRTTAYLLFYSQVSR